MASAALLSQVPRELCQIVKHPTNLLLRDTPSAFKDKNILVFDSALSVASPCVTAMEAIHRVSPQVLKTPMPGHKRGDHSI